MQPNDAASATDASRAEQIVSAILAERWPGAVVTGTRSVPGDASSRRYLRCEIDRSNIAAAPASAVVMLMDDAGTALSSEELAVYGDEGPSELPFINIWRYLSSRTDALPEIYAASQSEGWIVLEDVGDTPLWDAARSSADRAEALFSRALELLAQLQRAATDDGSGCYAFKQAFDQRLFSWEFDHFLEYGVERVSSAATSACRDELRDVAERLGALPRVFCHRDYHAWNIHVYEGRLRVLDFQDALLGPRLYDVASLLTDRCTPELIDTQMERRLVLGFADAIGREDLGGDSDIIEVYQLLALQRVLKVIGRFNYLAQVKGKRAYLEMLPSVINTAKRLLNCLDQLDATRQLIATSAKSGS